MHLLAEIRYLAATTLCRIAGLAVVLLGSARAAEVGELQLVRSVLEGPILRAELDAAGLRRQAHAAGPGVLADPSIGVRHEQANGPAGASTDVLGGSVTLDGLGLQRVMATTAAGLRHRAGPHWEEARRLEVVCRLRAEVADLHAALASASTSRAGQERLEGLYDTLEGLAEAGEASGYERDLAALARTEHHLSHVDAEASAVAMQAWFEARSGVQVDSVTLADTEAQGASTHPELEALELDVRAAERDRAAAQLGALPDLTIEGGARWDAMPDGSERTPGYEIGASVQLPLFERNRRDALARRSDAAEARAVLERRRAELTTRTAAAEARIALLSASPEGPVPEPLWEAARLRYQAGESSVEELLQAAERVEAAGLARIEHARRLRHAQLDRACAAGALPDPFDALVRETP